MNDQFQIILYTLYNSIQLFKEKQMIIKSNFLLKKENEIYLLIIELSIKEKMHTINGTPKTSHEILSEIKKFIDLHIQSKLKNSTKNIIIPYSQEYVNSYYQAETFILALKKIMPEYIIDIKDPEDIVNQKSIELKNKIYDIIVQSHPQGISLSNVTLKTRNLNKEVRKNVLNDLIYCDMIELIEDRSNGRIKNIFKVKVNND